MRHVFLALILICAASMAHAQVFFSNTRVGAVTQSHSTVGTSTTAAISSGSVAANLLAWQLCNDAVNTSTYLLVGKATDVATDGVMLGKGQCFVCPNCTGATLKLIKVKGQDASNGYSILQYKQQ